VDYSEYSQWYRLTTGDRCVGFVSADPIPCTAARVGWSNIPFCGPSTPQSVRQTLCVTNDGMRVSCVAPTMAALLHKGRPAVQHTVLRSQSRAVASSERGSHKQCRDVHERFAVTAARVHRPSRPEAVFPQRVHGRAIGTRDRRRRRPRQARGYANPIALQMSPMLPIVRRATPLRCKNARLCPSAES
jgi:hypothetical protein